MVGRETAALNTGFIMYDALKSGSFIPESRLSRLEISMPSLWRGRPERVFSRFARIISSLSISDSARPGSSSASIFT